MRRLFLIGALAAGALAQKATEPPDTTKPDTKAEDKEEIEQGIPITSELVRKTCSPCHKVDDKRRMSPYLLSPHDARGLGTNHQADDQPERGEDGAR